MQYSEKPLSHRLFLFHPSVFYPIQGLSPYDSWWEAGYTVDRSPTCRHVPCSLLLHPAYSSKVSANKEDSPAALHHPDHYCVFQVWGARASSHRSRGNSAVPPQDFTHGRWQLSLLVTQKLEMPKQAQHDKDSWARYGIQSYSWYVHRSMNVWMLDRQKDVFKWWIRHAV